MDRMALSDFPVFVPISTRGGWATDAVACAAQVNGLTLDAIVDRAGGS